MATPPTRYEERPKSFRITPEDITRALRGNSSKCAGARGFATSVPEASHIDVSIDGGITYIDNKTNERVTYPLLPARLKQMIIDWDSGKEIKPGTFKIRGAMVRDVMRRPGVGGRPRKDAAPKTDTTNEPVVKKPSPQRDRRTYGIRSLPINRV